MSPQDAFEAGQDLALALRRDVDLVDLARAPAVLRAQVVARGRCLHASDAPAAAAFEMYALSDYARLSEERREAVARGRLGLPQDSRDAFALLQQAGLLEGDLSLRLQRMVGFRNVVVHPYRPPSRPILLSIVRERLGDFEEFCGAAVRAPA